MRIALFFSLIQHIYTKLAVTQLQGGDFPKTLNQSQIKIPTFICFNFLVFAFPNILIQNKPIIRRATPIQTINHLQKIYIQVKDGKG